MEFDLPRVARNMTRHLYGTDIVSNNLANFGTTGFKRDVSFADWFVENISELGMRQYTDFTQGDLQLTDNPLDMALSGRGFFVVQTPTGIAFTRNGHFTVNDEGLVVTAQNHLLLGEQGPISVLAPDGTAGKIEVTRDGAVFINEQLEDYLVVANVPDLRSLAKIGANLFQAPGDTYITQLEPEVVDVRQGMLEGSNVQPVVEMMNLIDLNRNFESTQRVARAMDSVLGRATQLSDYR